MDGLHIYGENTLRRQNSLPPPAEHAEILKEFGCDQAIEPDLGLYIDNLLVQWLTSPETKSLISDLLSGKPVEKSKPRNKSQKNSNNSSSSSKNNLSNENGGGFQKTLQNPDPKSSNLQNHSLHNSSRHNSSEQESENFDHCVSPRSTSTGIKLPAPAPNFSQTENNDKSPRNSNSSPRTEKKSLLQGGFPKISNMSFWVQKGRFLSFVANFSHFRTFS